MKSLEAQMKQKEQTNEPQVDVDKQESIHEDETSDESPAEILAPAKADLIEPIEVDEGNGNFGKSKKRKKRDRFEEKKARKRAKKEMHREQKKKEHETATGVVAMG